MVLHKMNGNPVTLRLSEVRDVRSLRGGAGCVVMLAHEFLPVREAVGQVRRIMQWEKEAIQLRFDMK